MAALGDLLKKFSDWVQSNQVCGIDGTGKRAYYVPPYALEKYWEPERINIVLLASSNGRPISVSVSDIHRRFIRIFSTLCYSSKADNPRVNYITNFIRENLDDHNLPLEDRKDVFSSSDDGTQAWERFNQFQFLFNPLQFGPGLVHNRNIPTNCILPLDPVPVTISGGEGNKPVLKKYQLQEAGNLANIPEQTIVMKEFDLQEDEPGYTFDNEMEAYMALENNGHLKDSSEYFLRYYGSFKQNGKGFLLLEYADRGSLDQFFSKEQPPHEWDELHEFWRALLDLIRGLMLLHNLNKDQINNLRGIHQDLKPANIFVFKEGDDTSFRFRFKIGDFGLSSVRLHNVVHLDNKTTKMYGAPELVNTSDGLPHLVDPATPAVDIWSLGCILFETAVWTICGERGRSEFMRERQNDNKDKRLLCENGYQSAFHDGERTLPALDRMLNRILSRRRVFDDLTAPLADLIFQEMLLQKPSDRLAARYLERHFTRALEQCRSTRPGQGNSATPPKLPSPSSITPQYSRDQQGSSGYGTASNSGSPTARSRRVDAPTEFPLVFSPEVMSNPSFHPARSPTNTSTFDSWLDNVNPRVRKFSRCSYRVSSPHGDPGPGPSSYGPTQRDVSNRSRSSAVSVTFAPKSVICNHKHYDTYPMTTVNTVLEWISAKKDQRTDDLPGRRRAISCLEGREQIFVIEDSKSMRDLHWDDVTKTLKALAYLVKGCDPNGIELYLLSNPSIRIKGQKDKTRDVVDHLKSDVVSKIIPSDSGSIESSFSTILARLKNQMKSDTSGIRLSLRLLMATPNLTKANIYFFTDARWPPMGPSGPAIAEPIRTLVAEMKKHCRDRTDVSIQFIQFGDDPEAKKQLRYLDDTLGSEMHFDIVDRRTNRSNVWYMLLGSMNRDTDNIKDDSDYSDNESEVDIKPDDGMYTTSRGEQRGGGGAARQNLSSRASGGYLTPFQECPFHTGSGQQCTCGYHDQFGYSSNSYRQVR
ncbi:hypothetical protein B0T19DRAFT_443976 [Cercophora scortea]|uniref:Protein kinase domain-containing protein n=1 Tax=Cercophora scortea TaxID=314031 RepID=A0AAE0IH00_9PEZI|nr:hypothetical protein B0T19DRAFT_443976 [Cercophora scortea]